MPEPPPLDCLRFFDAAARHQNLSRAAEELGVTRAAVGHRIRMLERHLRAPLFTRRSRSIHLTGPGRRYHADVQRILQDIEDAGRCLRRRQAGRRPAPPRR